MSRFTYLLVDASAILVPFIFSFHPKIQFHKKWKAAIPALFITASFFIVWDIIFTQKGVWSFNDRYVTGIYLYNLPVEEVLFFLCIPYSCLFTYHCFGLLFTKERRLFSRLITMLLLIFLAGFAILFYSHLYTSVTFTLLFLLLFMNAISRNSNWLNVFYISYSILLIPFFICNGILTGTGPDEPVVIYNDAQNLGIRMLTIPVEDVFYGMLLILMNVTIYEYLLIKNSINQSIK